MRWSGHNFKAEGTQGAVFWTFHKRFLLMKIPNSLTSFVLVPRCTQCFFWTFPALDLALDPGTRLKEFRRWTMGSSRFGNKTLNWLIDFFLRVYLSFFFDIEYGICVADSFADFKYCLRWLGWQPINFPYCKQEALATVLPSAGWVLQKKSFKKCTIF